MPNIETLITVMIAGLLLSASPGPSMAYVLSRSAQHGAVGGLASSFGLAAGGMLHALLAVLGLGLLASAWPTLIQIVQYLGALYLIYLGYDILRSAFLPPATTSLQDANAKPDSVAVRCDVPGNGQQRGHRQIEHKLWLRLFAQGVVVELTNPKTILFFLSFLPKFVQSHSPGGAFLLSALIPITAIPADLLAIFAGSMLAHWAGTRPWMTGAINIFVALVLFAMATLLLVNTHAN